MIREVEDEGEFVGEGMKSLHLFQASPIIIGERQTVIKEKVSNTQDILIL